MLNDNDSKSSSLNGTNHSLRMIIDVYNEIASKSLISSEMRETIKNNKSVIFSSLTELSAIERSELETTCQREILNKVPDVVVKLLNKITLFSVCVDNEIADYNSILASDLMSLITGLCDDLEIKILKAINNSLSSTLLSFTINSKMDAIKAKMKELKPEELKIFKCYFSFKSSLITNEELHNYYDAIYKFICDLELLRREILRMESY
jgi:hypothetical protein